MKTRLILILSFILCVSEMHAQSLQRTSDRIKSTGNISFTEIVKFKLSFQDDFSIDTFKVFVTRKPVERQIGGYYLIRGKTDIYAYDGTKSIWLNFSDSTYKVTAQAVGSQYTRTLLYWQKEINRYLKIPSKITRLADTSICKTNYCRFLVMLADSIQKGKRVYNMINVITQQASGLLYQIRSEWNGFADDGAYMGMIEEHTFKDYQFNKPGFPDLSTATAPAGFKLPAKKQRVYMLSAGTQTPEMKLTDPSGKSFDLASLRGRIVLLNFTTDGCPHCVNAAEMLKRLYKQHRNEGLEIVSVYQRDFNSVNAITRFDAKNDIKYPSYLAEKETADRYHINGYPNFYLLDKTGAIVQAYEGFYATLEQEINDKLEGIK